MSGGGLSLCRLCRKTCDFSINIFDPNGTNGFLVWEIIKELLQLDVCKADGLPVTICRQCMDKVTEFKYFKTMCIASRIEFLKASASRGLIGNTAKKSRGVIGRGDDDANSKNRKRPLESPANPVAKKVAPSPSAPVVDSSVGKSAGVARERKTSSVSEASNSISLDSPSRSERPLKKEREGKSDGRMGSDGGRGGKTTPKGSDSESSKSRASQIRQEKSQVRENDSKSKSRHQDGVVGKRDSFASKVTEVKKPSQDANRRRFAFMSDESDIISDDSSCCEVPNLSDWSSEDEEKMESEVEVLPPVEDKGKLVERESKVACAELGQGKTSKTKGHAKHPITPHAPNQPPSNSGPEKKTVDHKTSLNRSQSGPLSKKMTAGKTSDSEKETSVRSKHPATRGCRVLVEDVLKNGTPPWLTRIGRTTYCVSLKTSPRVATEETGDSVTNHIPLAKGDVPKTEMVADSVQGGTGMSSSLQKSLKTAKTKSVRGRGRIHNRKIATSTTDISRKSVKKSREIISSSEEESNCSDHESASEITTSSKLGLDKSGGRESKKPRERSAGDVSGSESCDASLRSISGSLKAAKTKSVPGRSRILESKMATSTASISRKPVKKSRNVVSSSEEENNSGDGDSVKNATSSKPGLGESGGRESKKSRERSAGDVSGSESCDASLRSVSGSLKAAKTKSVLGRSRILESKMATSTASISRKPVKKSSNVVSSSEEENNSGDGDSVKNATSSKPGLGESGGRESKKSRERSAGDVSGSESCDASLRSVSGSLKAAKTKSVLGRSRILESKMATSTASISRKPVKKSSDVVSSSEEENNSGDGDSVKNATSSKPGSGESGGRESKKSRERSAGDVSGSESCDASLKSVSRASVSSGGKEGDVSSVEAPKKSPADASPLHRPPEVSPSKLKEMAKSLGMPEVRVKLEKLPEFVVSSVGGCFRVRDGGAVEGIVGSSKGGDEKCSQCGMWFPTRVLLKVHTFLEHSKAHEHHKASRLGAELSEKSEFEVHCSVALRQKKPKKSSPGRKALAKGKPADGEQSKGDVNSGEEMTNDTGGGEGGVEADEAEGMSGSEDGEESSQGSSDGDGGSGDDSVASERSKGGNSKEPGHEGDRSECSSVGDGPGKASGESDSKIADASETGVTSTSPTTETVSVALEQLETGDDVSKKSREPSSDIGNSNSASETTEDNVESSKQSGSLGGEQLEAGEDVSKTSKEPSSDIGNSNAASETTGEDSVGNTKLPRNLGEELKTGEGISKTSNETSSDIGSSNSASGNTEDNVEGGKKSRSLGGDVSVVLGQLETEEGICKTSKEPSSDHGDANPASEVVELSSKGDLETSKGLDTAPKECGEASDNLSHKKANCESTDILEATTTVGSSNAVLKASNKNGEDPDLLVSADKTVKNDAVNENSKSSESSTVGSSALKEQESTDVSASVAVSEKGGDSVSSQGNSSVSEAKKEQKAMEKSEAGGSSSQVLTESNDSVLKIVRSVSSEGSKTGDSKKAESLGAKVESSSVSRGSTEKSKVGDSKVGDVLHREIAIPNVSGGSTERSKTDDSKKADNLSKEIKPSNASSDLSEKSKAQDSKKGDSLRKEIKSSGASGDSSKILKTQDSKKDDGLGKAIESSIARGDSSEKSKDSKKADSLSEEIKSSSASGNSTVTSKALDSKKGDSLRKESKSSGASGDSSEILKTQDSKKDDGLGKEIKSAIASGDSSEKLKDSEKADSLSEEIKSSTRSGDSSITSNPQDSKKDNGLSKGIKSSTVSSDSSGKPKIQDSEKDDGLRTEIKSSCASSTSSGKPKTQYSEKDDSLGKEIKSSSGSGNSSVTSKTQDSKKDNGLRKAVKSSIASGDSSGKPKTQDSKKDDGLSKGIKSSSGSDDLSEKSKSRESERDDGLRKEIEMSSANGDSSGKPKTQDSKKDDGLSKGIKSSSGSDDLSEKSKSRESERDDGLRKEIEMSSANGDSSGKPKTQDSKKDNGLCKEIKSSIASVNSSGKPKTQDSKKDDSLDKGIKSSRGSDDLSEKSKSRETKRDDGLRKEIEMSSGRGDSSVKPKIGGTKKADCLNAEIKHSGASGNSSEASKTGDSKVTDGVDSEIKSSGSSHNSSETSKARDSQKAGVSSTEIKHSSLNSGSSKKSKTGDLEVADRLSKEVKPAAISTSSREKSKSGDSRVADGVGTEITSSHLPSQAEISAGKRKVSNCIDSDAEGAGKVIVNRTSRGNCTASPAAGENGVGVKKVATCDNGVGSKASGLPKPGADVLSMKSDESCLETDASAPVRDLVKISIQVEDSKHSEALQTGNVDSNLAEGANDASASRRSAEPPKSRVPNVTASKSESCFPPSTPR
ncbi:mucin-19-like isoform X2 [Ischnura elegans]|uniref:mucin-19-like isoform X2 n=1 Tax=Ischnura elegans TaxID=197161 RepID=UPI001ED87E27|nr:mucin-19-like isoform X2 [Ischnura elegans]